MLEIIIFPPDIATRSAWSRSDMNSFLGSRISPTLVNMQRINRNVFVFPQSDLLDIKK